MKTALRNLIGRHLRLDYGDHCESLASQMPLHGTVALLLKSQTDAGPWFQVELDRPIDLDLLQMEEVAGTCSTVLIRSGWEGVEIGDAGLVPVRLHLVTACQRMPVTPFRHEDYLHIAWALCHVSA